MSTPLFHLIPSAPEPVAPFSHAVEQDGWVFVTGQLPFTGIANDPPYPKGIEAQTRQVLANLQRVLVGCALGLEHVLAVRGMFQRCWSAILSGCMRRRATPEPTE